MAAVDINSTPVPLIDSHSTGLVAITFSNEKSQIQETDSLQNSNSIADPEKDLNVNLVNEATLLYPNPTHDYVNIKFEALKDEMISVDLFDVNGKWIRKLLPAKKIQSGQNEMRFDLSTLAPATYLIILIRNGKVETKRVVVI